MLKKSPMGFQTIHGHAGSRDRTKKKPSGEYLTWLNMIARCTNPKRADYPYYGGRGITYDPRWKKYPVFLADVGPKPSPKHTLDRYPNVNGNYEKSNVRWATREEQGRNKRNNKRYTSDGESLTIPEWAKKTGLSEQLIYDRVNLLRWPIQKAITNKANAHHRRITFNGMTKTLTEWAEHTGLNRTRLKKRLLANWSVERTLTTPIDTRRATHR